MSEPANEAQRCQTLLRAKGLAFAGYGICPGCLQKKEVFVVQRGMPGTGKERCLNCWKAE